MHSYNEEPQGSAADGSMRSECDCPVHSEYCPVCKERRIRLLRGTTLPHGGPSTDYAAQD